MYRLQRKEPYVLPNILGNHSMPVHTYRWRDIAICEDYDALYEVQKECKPAKDYRIIET